MGSWKKVEDPCIRHYIACIRLMMGFLLFSSDVSIDEKKVSEILGDLIWEEMSECIIRECLVHSIPTNSSQLAEYSEVRLQGSVSIWQLHSILCNTIFNCVLRSLNRQRILRAVWKRWGTSQGTQQTSWNMPGTSTATSQAKNAKMSLWLHGNWWLLRCTTQWK